MGSDVVFKIKLGIFSILLVGSLIGGIMCLIYGIKYQTEGELFKDATSEQCILIE